MKTKLTALLIAIIALIGITYAQSKINIYQGGEVVYSRPIAEIDSIKFETDNNGISTEKYYRIKNVETGLYMNAANYDYHYTGSFGGVNCTAYAQDADQIFKFEVSGDKFKVITNSGYYLYCQQWIVDAQTTGVDLSFVKNDDETYDIMFGESYFAVDELNGYYYPFCNATEEEKATWVLEEATPLPTYTVSVSATEGGTASTSVNSMAQGGSATLFATPESGYRFVNWTVNGSEVSTENIFVATITANTAFVANFEENTSDYEISLTKEYRIKHVESGMYMNVADNYEHVGGSYGGVNCVAYAEDDNQIFVFEAVGTNYYLKSKTGYYIYCQQWNVDALTYASELTLVDNLDGTYYIKNGAAYFKVEQVEGVYYPYGDAPAELRATWILEEVGGEEPTPTYTVSVSATEGGIVTTSAESVEEGGSVTLTATANSGYEFVNWTLNGVVVSTENPYTATITANSEFVANFEAEENQSGELHNGHEYVDLGLPSGLKWATCNVGATTPEGYGSYFAWGETEPKATYNESTYKYCNGTIDSFTKYCTESDIGFDFGTEDNKTMLELSDDAARVNWGGDWRMPTGDEMEELMDTNNCTWEWTTQNGVNGYKVTSKKNGNSIFLPAAGERQNDNLANEGSNGHYWSSSLVASYCYCANYILFDSGSVGLYDSPRVIGQPVRAVFGEKQSFTVSVSAGTGGSATASSESVEEGGSVTLTATANSGYEFVNWTLNGVVVSTENPYTVTVTANSEFVANFEKYVTLWRNASSDLPGHGTFTVILNSTNETLASSSRIPAGSELTLTATPSDLTSVFKYWKITTFIGATEETVTITDNPATITVTDNTNISPVFDLVRYKISVKTNGGGTAVASIAEAKPHEEVIFTATPADGYAFLNWTVNGEEVSTEFSHTEDYRTEDFEITANFIEYKKTGTLKNHDYVDLGLPSGTKWSTHSVGATKAEEEGDYFAWGETVPKDTYTSDNYKYEKTEWDSYNGVYWYYDYGKDGRTELESMDDAARVSWGEGWRMPTKEEVEELCNTDNCIWTFTIINEVSVYKVTSKTNGNYIFFIASNTVGGENGRYLNAYWTRNLKDNDEAYYMYPAPNKGVVSFEYRTRGLNVRAVCTKGKEDVTPLPTYTVSTSATEGGTVTSSASSVEQGGSVTLTATPISGYVFKNWTLNGVVVSTENPYTTTINANSEYVANFEAEVSDSGISLTKGYRIKHVESGMYLNVENIDEHTGGTNGGVNCVAYAISNNQIFSFEAVGSNFYLKSKSGYYIYCQDWNVDALSQKTALTFTENEDGTYYILNGSKYFKVEQVNGTYYPYGDAPADFRATWVLEEAIETPPTTAVYNGHEYIDLGLSVKWATCNVGATTPEGYGDYFAWGETEPKDFYNWNTYKHCVENGDYYSVNSYCPNSDIGVEDNRTILDAEDDAASANWGGNWRMPTKEEQEELLNNCIWEWTRQNGIFGYKIISKINGNSIFLPAAGFFLDENANPGNCNYWSSSVKINSNSSAACLITDSIYYDYRNYGKSVRAVCE